MSILETSRLILRPFVRDDAEMMYRNWTSREDVAEYCRWYPHKSVAETEMLLDSFLENAKKGFDYRWAITLRVSGEVVGIIDVVDVLDEGKTAEIGYAVSPDYWGRGIASESLKAVIDKLFGDGFQNISAVHHVDNPASGRVMEKCRMVQCGFDTRERKFGSEETCKVRCYKITKGK